MSFSSGGASGTQNIAGHDLKQIPNYTPQMMQLFQSLLGGAQQGAPRGLSFLSQLAGGDESAFADLEAPAYAAFNKSLGQIGSRFSQFGAQDSSAFQNALSGAGGQLAQNLQSQRADYRLNAIKELLGNSQQLLGQKPYENVLTRQEDNGFDFGDILGKALPALIGLLG